MKNNINKTKKIFDQLIANKRNTAVAFCLVVLMIFMWGRVFARKSPNAAAAATAQTQTTPLPKAVSDLKISFIDLPMVAGRNDVIGRDFFDAGGWEKLIQHRERRIKPRPVEKE